MSILEPCAARQALEGLSLPWVTRDALQRILDLSWPDGRIPVSIVIDTLFPWGSHRSGNRALRGIIDNVNTAAVAAGVALTLRRSKNKRAGPAALFFEVPDPAPPPLRMDVVGTTALNESPGVLLLTFTHSTSPSPTAVSDARILELLVVLFQFAVWLIFHLA